MVFKGAFAKLQRATNPLASVMSDCPSVRLSVRMEQLGTYWTDFHKI